MSTQTVVKEDHKPLRVASYYMNIALEPKKIKAAAKNVLQGELASKQFDTIVGTGFSGTLPLYTISEIWKTYFGFVRKPGVQAHSNKPFEGDFGRNWIFVDDFISGGDTFIRTWEAIDKMAELHKIPHQCVGAWSYANTPGMQFSSLYGLRKDFSRIQVLARDNPRFEAQLNTELTGAA